MGRKPLDPDAETVKFTLRFPASLLRRIEAIAGAKRGAIFIREAAERAVQEHEDGKPPKPR